MIPVEDEDGDREGDATDQMTFQFPPFSLSQLDSVVYTPISFEKWPHGAEPVAGLFPITIHRQDDPSFAYTVYMEESSHYFKPNVRSSLRFWSLTEALMDPSADVHPMNEIELKDKID
jgi:hypothetical protein